MGEAIALSQKGITMSLTVPPDLVEQAYRGQVDDAAFLDCVRTSLPYAWDVITGLIGDLEAGGGEFADNQVPPPDEQARGQLLRLMASDAMRAALERRYGVRLAFQNCHRAAVFRPAALAALAEFTSPAAQLRNQKPELVDC
jgi:NucS shadow ORF